MYRKKFYNKGKIHPTVGYMVYGTVGQDRVTKEAVEYIKALKELENIGTTSGYYTSGWLGDMWKKAKKVVKQVVDPREHFKIAKNAVKANVDAVKNWANEVKRNPAALLRPPLPRTGNPDIDKKVLEKIEDVARKVDPTYQVIEHIRGKKSPKALTKQEKQREKYQTELKQAERKWDTERKRLKEQIDELKKLADQAKQFKGYIADINKNRGLFMNKCRGGSKQVKSFDVNDKKYVICDYPQLSSWQQMRKAQGLTYGYRFNRR